MSLGSRRWGAAGKNQPGENPFLAQIAVVAQGLGEQVAIGDHHPLAVKAAQVRAAQAHLNHPTPDIIEPDQIPDHEGLIKQDRQVGEEVPGGPLQGGIGCECLKLKAGMATHAAFFETRR